LILVCGIDSTNKTVPVCSSLTTNEKKDTFTFFIENLALIFGRKWGSRVEAFVSDGANEITSALDNAILTGTFQPSTQRFLCHHHAVNTKGLKDLASLNENESSLRSVLFLLIYRGFRQLESKEEEKIYFRAERCILLGNDQREKIVKGNIC
jgi:hypothetical protein